MLQPLSGAAAVALAAALALGCRSPRTSLPPVAAFCSRRTKVLLGQAAARVTPHAWHLLLALWWLLSNQGLTASALTKAEARVPLSSLCFDPRPGSRRCRAGGREQRGGADLLWAWPALEWLQRGSLNPGLVDIWLAVLASPLTLLLSKIIIVIIILKKMLCEDEK